MSINFSGKLIMSVTEICCHIFLHIYITKYKLIISLHENYDMFRGKTF